MGRINDERLKFNDERLTFNDERGTRRLYPGGFVNLYSLNLNR